MKAIVGLGNPGSRYDGTRHNIGSSVVEAMAERHHLALTHVWMEPKTKRMVGRYGDYRHGREIVRLAVPLVLMNESGKLLQRLMVDPDALLLVFDDVNLPLGVIRLRAQGSDGGHHGVASCLEVLQTQKVARLRIGIGTHAMSKDLKDFVLGYFKPEERLELERTIERAVEACEIWVKEGIHVAMNQYNSRARIE